MERLLSLNKETPLVDIANQAPPLSGEAIAAIEADAAHRANNCGGCETCFQVFGNAPDHDAQTLYELVRHIRYLEAKLAAQ